MGGQEVSRRWRQQAAKSVSTGMAQENRRIRASAADIAPCVLLPVALPLPLTMNASMPEIDAAFIVTPEIVEDQGARGGLGAFPKLAAAVYADDLDAVVAELAAGADPDMIGYPPRVQDLAAPMSWPLIFQACTRFKSGCCDDRIIRAFARGGCDLNGQDSGGYYTPLHLFASNGFDEGIRLLCELGANVHQGTNDGMGPCIREAVKHGHLSTIRVLSELGADLNVTTADQGIGLVCVEV